MLYLVLSILFSVALLVNFRIFPKYQISTFQAVAFNYLFCFITGLILMPENQTFELNLKENWIWYCLLLGLGFIITFILSGISTQKAGISATSLANNISLIIPVSASLFLFDTGATAFKWHQYLGLLLALIALALSAWQKEKKQGNFLLPLAVFLMYGITNTAINYLNLKFIPNPEKTIPVTLVMVLGALVSGIIALLVQIIRKKEKLAFKNLVAACCLGIPNFLSFYFLLLALSAYKNSGAFVYPLYNVGVILLATLVAVVYFKETLSNTKKAGLLLAVVAICLLALV